MYVMPDFRRRIPRRGEYSVLENTESETNSVQRRYVPSSRSSDTSSVNSLLCDKCWLRQQRKFATKRCLQCKDNLCDACAKYEQNKRPRSWWLPCWFVQCLRFLFTKPNPSHYIIDLPPPMDRPTHWAHSSDVSSVQRIPRVRRTSFTSNESKSTKSSKNINANQSINNNYSNYDVYKPHKFGSVSSDNHYGRPKQVYRPSSNNPSRQLIHSQSFDGKHNHRRENFAPPYRRSRSSQGLSRIYEKAELDRLEQYNRNWEIGFKQEHNDLDKGHGRHGIRRRYSNKMKGKDIDIEFTEREIKLTVNPDDKTNSRGRMKSASKCAVTKSKKKHTDNATKQYTEQMFKEVPIWFKKDEVRAKDKRWSLSRSKSPEVTSRYHNSAFVTESMFSQNHHQIYESTSEFSQHQTSMFTAQHCRSYQNSNTSTPYIVEEPPDNCPICLEALPGNEARALICCHALHTVCLIKYSRKMDSDFGIMCPLCSTTTVIRNYYAPREMWYKELPISSSV